MLPRATAERTQRESVKGKLGGRTHEIQRLIGRSLRGAVDLTRLGERTITIDCDVLQADGGTRSASITGGYVALAAALITYGLERHLVGKVAAVSVGIVDGAPLLDLDYAEDSQAEVDFNVVGTDAGTYVEVQGTAEGKPFDRAGDGRADRARDGRHRSSCSRPRPRSSRRSGADRWRARRATAAGRRDPFRHKVARAADAARRSDGGELVSRWTTSASRATAIEDRRDVRGECRVKARFAARRDRACRRSPTTRASRSTRSAAGRASGRGATPASDATDAQNNAKLLAELDGLPPERRGARYVCVLALALPGDAGPRGGLPVVAVRGTCRGPDRDRAARQRRVRLRPDLRAALGAARRADARRVDGRREERDLASRRGRPADVADPATARVLTVARASQHLRLLRGEPRQRSALRSMPRSRSGRSSHDAGSSWSTAAAGSG